MEHALRLQPLTLSALPSYPGTGMGGSNLIRDQRNQFSHLGGRHSYPSLSRKCESHFTSSYKNIISLLTFPISLFKYLNLQADLSLVRVGTCVSYRSPALWPQEGMRLPSGWWLPFCFYPLQCPVRDREPFPAPLCSQVPFCP